MSVTPAAPTPRRVFATAGELVLLALLAMLWGSSYGFIKLGVATIPPLTLIGARTLIAGLLLLAVLHLRRIALPRDAASWQSFLVQACLNSAIPFTLIAWAEQTVDAGLAVILNSTTPIFAFLVTAAITRHEAVTLRKLFGICAGLAGTCLLVGMETLQGAGRGLVPELAIIGATLCYGCAAVFGRRFKDLDPMVPATGSLLCGAALLVPASFLLDRPWTITPSATSVMALLALAVFCTALAFVLYFRLFRTLGSVGATAQAYLRVPVGVAFGVLALGETPSPTAWIGLACVIAGVLAMTVPGRPVAPSAAPAGVPGLKLP